MPDSLCSFPRKFLGTQVALLRPGNTLTVERPKTKLQKVCVGCSCLLCWSLCVFGDYCAVIYFTVGLCSFLADTNFLPPSTRIHIIDRHFATLSAIPWVWSICRQGLWGNPWRFAFQCVWVSIAVWVLQQSRALPKTAAAGWQWAMWHSIWHLVIFGCAFYTFTYDVPP